MVAHCQTVINGRAVEHMVQLFLRQGLGQAFGQARGFQVEGRIVVHHARLHEPAAILPPRRQFARQRPFAQALLRQPFQRRHKIAPRQILRRFRRPFRQKPHEFGQIAPVGRQRVRRLALLPQHFQIAVQRQSEIARQHFQTTSNTVFKASGNRQTFWRT